MSAFTILEEYRSKYESLVNWFMYSELAVGAPEDLYRAAFHLIKAGGKRFRPMIVLSTARMLGGEQAETRALPLASAVEILHNFTLIHDDIMDNDDFRRGVPTTHKIWGVPFAILAGDLDYALAYKSLLMSKKYGLQQERILRAVEILTEATIKVSQGQAYDMRFEKEQSVDYNDYLEMIYLKTGALIEASAKLGAVAAVDEPSLIEKLGNYGKFVGIAFQIRDDILGIYGDPSKTGKPVYSDLKRSKKTLLLLYAYQHADGRDKEILEKILNRQRLGEEEYGEAADIIKRTGAYEYAQSLANKLAENAVRILNDITAVDEKAKEALRELAEFSVKREK